MASAYRLGPKFLAALCVENHKISKAVFPCGIMTEMNNDQVVNGSFKGAKLSEYQPDYSAQLRTA